MPTSGGLPHDRRTAERRKQRYEESSARRDRLARAVAGASVLGRQQLPDRRTAAFAAPDPRRFQLPASHLALAERCRAAFHDRSELLETKTGEHPAIIA